MKRIMLLLAAVALLALSLAPVVQAQGQGGAPKDVDETLFPIEPGAFPGTCDFTVGLEQSGKGKTIMLPDDKGLILTSPGLDATLTNLDNPEHPQETYNITGSVHVSTDPETGDVTTVLTGRNLAIDPEAGFVIAVGDFSFVFNEQGELIQPLEGSGQLIDVCEALA